MPLVVAQIQGGALSSPIANPDDTVGTITALDGTVVAANEGWSSCSVTISGTWEATLVFEISSDGGTTWGFGAFVKSPTGLVPIPSIAVAVTTNGGYQCIGMGATTHARIRAISYTSGTVNVRLVFGSNLPPMLSTFSAIQQNVMASMFNSTTENLASQATFTGTAESTLGVSGIQVNVASDQPCLLDVEQSSDGTNWDQCEQWIVLGGRGDGRTFQAVGSYFRLICQNIGPATTTYLRIQTAMCPTVEVVPKALTPAGRLRLATMTTSYVPDPANFTDLAQSRALHMDSGRNLVCRSAVFTDESSFRDDFIGNSIYTDFTGTCYFTNGSVYVTGAGTSFTTEANTSEVLRLSSHADSVATPIFDVLSDTLIQLAEPYPGATGSGTGRSSEWRYTADTGTTLTQASSELALVSGTTSGSVVQATRDGDYLPIIGRWSFRVSQRIANQSIVVGLQDDPSAPETRGSFLIDGTTATTIKCQSSSSSGDVEETVATLPDGLTTATKARYTIEVTTGTVVFSCNDVVLTRHRSHLPDNYAVLNNVLRIQNTGTPASSTTLYVDVAAISNFDVVEIGRQVTNDPLPVRSVEEIHTICGTITTTATTADQVVLSYTVPANKTFWIVGYTLNNGETTIRANPYKIGRNTVTSEPAGPGTVDGAIFRMGNMPASSFRDEDFSGNPRRMAIAGDVVKITVTPSGGTSTVWRACLDFILR